MNEIKEFLKFGVLPILSGIGFLHITVNYVHNDLGTFSLLFRATIIIFVFIMWCYGLDKLHLDKLQRLPENKFTKGRKNA